MKEARVVAPRFLRLAMAMGSAIDEEWTWEALSFVIEANLKDWDDFADVFAGALTYDDWFALYQAIRPMELLTLAATHEDGSRVTGEGAERLREVIDRVVEAGMVLTVIGISGTKRRPLRRAFRGLWWTFRPPNQDDLLREAGLDPADFDSDQ
jgi:hypothetical protein